MDPENPQEGSKKINWVQRKSLGYTVLGNRIPILISFLKAVTRKFL